MKKSNKCMTSLLLALIMTVMMMVPTTVQVNADDYSGTHQYWTYEGNYYSYFDLVRNSNTLSASSTSSGDVNFQTDFTTVFPTQWYPISSATAQTRAPLDGLSINFKLNSGFNFANYNSYNGYVSFTWAKNYPNKLRINESLFPTLQYNKYDASTWGGTTVSMLTNSLSGLTVTLFPDTAGSDAGTRKASFVQIVGTNGVCYAGALSPKVDLSSDTKISVQKLSSASYAVKLNNTTLTTLNLSGIDIGTGYPSLTVMGGYDTDTNFTISKVCDISAGLYSSPAGRVIMGIKGLPDADDIDEDSSYDADSVKYLYDRLSATQASWVPDELVTKLNGCIEASEGVIITDKLPKKVVSTYVNPDFGVRTSTLTNADIQALDVIYYCGMVVNSNSYAYIRNTAADFSDFARIRQINPDIKIILSVGPDDVNIGSNAVFYAATNTPTKRASLISSMISVFNQYNSLYGLDGFDIDWEYPTNAAEISAHTSFMADLGAALNLTSGGTNKIFTVAVPASPWAFSVFDMPALNNIVDFFNIMSYDNYINSSYPTMHHTAPRPSKLDIVGASLEATIEYFGDRGITTRKLIGGCGLYTIGYAGVSAGLIQGLWMPKSGSSYPASGNYHYNQLSTLTAQGFTKYWDSASQASWMYRSSDSVFLTFDDDLSIAAKCAVVNETSARGLMIWELSCFYGTSVLSSMNQWINS